MDMDKYEDEILALAKVIKESKNIVFFGGAGVSTESGVPDFRSVDGLYNMKYDYPPETILSHTFFRQKTDEFYRFYKDKMLFSNIEPNYAHKFLSRLEKIKNLSIVTQNIDGLHQMAGSKKVYELHGSVLRNYCMHCGSFFDVKYIKNSSDIPRCNMCGGIVKPDVVLYEESLDEKTIYSSIDAIRNADALIIAGTSLSVYPAAGFIDYFQGENLIVINKGRTERSVNANIVIDGKVGEVFKRVDKLLYCEDNYELSN